MPLADVSLSSYTSATSQPSAAAFALHSFSWRVTPSRWPLGSLLMRT